MTMQKSTDVLNQLWQTLLEDPEIVVDGWHGLVLVGQVGTNHSEMSGYAYDTEGREEAIAPRKSGTLGLMRQLCKVMEEETGRRWKVCPIEIKRNGKASIDFEFVDSDRWHIGPATYAARIEEFRKILE
jgi:hypothetical protein